jgi:chromate transporter
MPDAVSEPSQVEGPVRGSADRGAAGEVASCSLGAFLGYFLYLGTFGFGGPIALAAAIQRDLVDRRRWISRHDYVEALAFAQLCPGPLAAQLAMYLGWVRAKLLGATLVSAAFIGPSFLMVLGLSALYLRFEGLWWVQGVFYGVGAAVIAILSRSVFKLVRSTLTKDWLLWPIFAGSALVTALTGSEIVWIFLLGGGDRPCHSSSTSPRPRDAIRLVR